MKLKVSTLPVATVRFRKVVWAYYKKNGRHDLPWRKTTDVYKILVSEVMLQQTQVERVIPFYTKFIKKFPTAKKLAAAPLSDVLKSWQGLGYNRRAKQLKAAAQALTTQKISTVEELESLPGVGPYTARAVAAFACNEDVVFVETNIRTAVIQHFFSDRKEVSDSSIEGALYDALPKGKAREWYSALMDYGASLKRSGISHNVRSTTYVKQSTFSGSLREARGAILRELASGGAPSTRLIDLLGSERRVQMRTALRALFSERLVKKVNENYTLG
ncbi:A/G-specific adenine glycosylase [Candidatus Kaiserbacteria bacterium]|nr:A/G-specific adenine glycosylase [Candidatus Kaiserbacteria bacterium]